MDANIFASRRSLWFETNLLKSSSWSRDTYFMVKRIIDIVLIVFFLPVLLPLCLLIALAIKLNSPGGPVVFTQLRTGKNGQRFRMYKFRTMVPNAEELKKALMHLNELQPPDFKITNDPRITRVGRFLRKTSLDELPQLLNILRGEMTFVGPRPTSFSAETYASWHKQRLSVIPGLTVLWQITGRGSTEFDERVRIDLDYIKNCCLWLDLQIIFRTIFAVLEQRGA